MQTSGVPNVVWVIYIITIVIIMLIVLYFLFMAKDFKKFRKEKEASLTGANSILEAIEKGICPITGKSGLDTTINITKWSYYVILIGVENFDVPVSAEGKELNQKNTSTVWEFLDSIGKILMYIPLIGGIFTLILFFFSFTYGLILWIVLDSIFGRKHFGRGLLRIDPYGNVVRINSK